MLLINIIIILYEWSKASLATLFWAVVFLLFSVPHIIHAYGDDYSERTIFQVTLFAVIFMCCYLAVRFLYFSSGRRGEGSIDSNLLIHEDRRFVDFIFAVYFVCFLIITLEIVSSPDLSKPMNVVSCGLPSLTSSRNESE